MNNLQNVQKGNELINTIVSKSWEDAAFKQQLIENPTMAIQSIAGDDFAIPAGQKIVVTDFSNADYDYLIIPAKAEVEDLELTDEELEAVSGGWTPLVAAAVAAVISGWHMHESVDNGSGGGGEEDENCP